MGLADLSIVNTHPVTRAIGVSHTACKDEFRRNVPSYRWSFFFFFFSCIFIVVAVVVVVLVVAIAVAVAAAVAVYKG